MNPVEHRPCPADASFDGLDLDCGNGLLLLIRQHLDPLEPGQLLEFHSTEISVDEDVPAWCRLTGNELVSWTKKGKDRSFLVCKGSLGQRRLVRSRPVFETSSVCSARRSTSSSLPGRRWSSSTSPC